MKTAQQTSRRLQRRGEALQRRARPQVQCVSVAVPLPVQPTAAECGALVRALIKHLLFQRAQIPYLYDELLRSVQQQQRAAAAEAEAAGGSSARRRRSRLPKADKRLVKFLAKAEELLGAVNAALRALTTPARCFVLLGSSTAKPREAYEVLLPTPSAAGATAVPAAGEGMAAMAAAQAAPQQAAAQEQQQARAAAPSGRARLRLSRSDRLCQLAVRHLVVAGAELPEGTAHQAPCKLFVLLEAGSAGSSGGGGSGSNPLGHQGAWQQAQQQEGATVLAAPHGFAVKRNFKLSMRKGLHLKLLLGQHSDSDQHQQQREQQQQQQDQAACAGGPEEGSSESQGSAAADPMVHLSQLPDAASDSQQPPEGPEAGAGAVPHIAAGTGAGAPAAAGSGHGSVWYLCKAVPKGLNSGSSDAGCAQSFDGL